MPDNLVGLIVLLIGLAILLALLTTVVNIVSEYERLVVFFLGRTVRSSKIRQTLQSSRAKVAHIVRVTHRDEVEAPLTDWLREAYDASEKLSSQSRRKPAPRRQ